MRLTVKDFREIAELFQLRAVPAEGLVRSRSRYTVECSFITKHFRAYRIGVCEIMKALVLLIKRRLNRGWKTMEIYGNLPSLFPN